MNKSSIHTMPIASQTSLPMQALPSHNNPSLNNQSSSNINGAGFARLGIKKPSLSYEEKLLLKRQEEFHS